MLIKKNVFGSCWPLSVFPYISIPKVVPTIASMHDEPFPQRVCAMYMSTVTQILNLHALMQLQAYRLLPNALYPRDVMDFTIHPWARTASTHHPLRQAALSLWRKYKHGMAACRCVQETRSSSTSSLSPREGKRHGHGRRRQAHVRT